MPSLRRFARVARLPCAALICMTAALSSQAASEAATKLTPHQQLAREIYKELVEINTSQSAGDTYAAAKAMAARLKAAGFPDADVQSFETAPKRGNLVARIHGTGKRKPMLLLA